MLYLFDKKERKARWVLKRLSKQNVTYAKNGTWLVERGIKITDEVTVALRTCHLRGWIEPITKEILHSSYSKSLELESESMSPVYRLTASGWDIINNSYAFIKLTFLITAISLIITFIK